MTPPGFFELYSAARPALPAGAYTASSTQDLVAATPHDGDQQIPVDDTAFHLHIDAPRYAMPPDQILSTFPPAGSQGDWRERLPQIVLKRRTLPWERNPTFNPQSPPEHAPPWLALVVLAEGEGQLSTDVDPSQCVTSDVDLGADADVPKGKYLEVTKDIVEKVFPCQDELDLLCHVRKVDLNDTELALGDDDGYLAVVLANRLPQPATPKQGQSDATPLKYTAYLINLEHQIDKLLATEPAPSPFFNALEATVLVNAEFMRAAPRGNPRPDRDAARSRGGERAPRGPGGRRRGRRGRRSRPAARWSASRPRRASSPRRRRGPPVPSASPRSRPATCRSPATTSTASTTASCRSSARGTASRCSSRGTSCAPATAASSG